MGDRLLAGAFVLAAWLPLGANAADPTAESLAADAVRLTKQVPLTRISLSDLLNTAGDLGEVGEVAEARRLATAAAARLLASGTKPADFESLKNRLLLARALARIGDKAAANKLLGEVWQFRTKLTNRYERYVLARYIANYAMIAGNPNLTRQAFDFGADTLNQDSSAAGRDERLQYRENLAFDAIKGPFGDVAVRLWRDQKKDHAAGAIKFLDTLIEAVDLTGRQPVHRNRHVGLGRLLQAAVGDEAVRASSIGNLVLFGLAAAGDWKTVRKYADPKKSSAEHLRVFRNGHAAYHIDYGKADTAEKVMTRWGKDIRPGLWYALADRLMAQKPADRERARRALAAGDALFKGFAPKSDAAKCVLVSVQVRAAARVLGAPAVRKYFAEVRKFCRSLPKQPRFVGTIALMRAAAAMGDTAAAEEAAQFYVDTVNFGGRYRRYNLYRRVLLMLKAGARRAYAKAIKVLAESEQGGGDNKQWARAEGLAATAAALRRNRLRRP